MLQYGRIKLSERTDINKSNKSKECMICQHWYLKILVINLNHNVCIKCHDIAMMANELEKIAILNINSVNRRCVLWNMTKNDAINRLNSSKLDNKGTL